MQVDAVALLCFWFPQHLSRVGRRTNRIRRHPDHVYGLTELPRASVKQHGYAHCSVEGYGSEGLKVT